MNAGQRNMWLFFQYLPDELMWNPPFRCSHSTGMMKSLLNLLFTADIKSAGYEMYYAICFTSIILCCIFNDRMYYLQIHNHQSNILYINTIVKKRLTKNDIERPFQVYKLAQSTCHNRGVLFHMGWLHYKRLNKKKSEQYK